jgi:outer membrane lipase/esterase
MRRCKLAAIASAASVLVLTAPAAAQTQPQPQPQNPTSDGQPIKRVVVFGDSLSDGGFFRAVTPLPPGAGRFTTNPDLVSPELVALRLGLTVNSAYGLNGTNFAVGGARVTAANGPSIPITTQINNFLAAGGSFGPNDLVYIQGGGNDFFAFQAGGSTNNAILTTAANDLARQVQRVQAAGAQRIVTLAVQTGGAPGLQLFNQTYGAALASAGVNALYFDTDRLFNEIVANAASFGITNVTSTACLGSSLTCTPATYRTPNANETFLLADSVHPSGITQRIQADAIASLIVAPEQIGRLAEAGQSLMRGHTKILEGPMHGALSAGGSGLRLFGNVGYHYHSSPGSRQQIGLSERSLLAQLGADVALSDSLGVGVAGTYSDGDGQFRFNSGGYDVSAWSVTGYARAALGPLAVGAAATYGSLQYDDITRRVRLTSVTREHRGDTDGTYFAANGSVGLMLGGAAVRFGPEAGLSYEKVKLDGYAEDSTQSTAATFGDQELESLTGRVGVLATSHGEAPVRVLARISYERELETEDRSITMRPSGAPITYTSSLGRLDRDYVSFNLTVGGEIAPRLGVQAGVRGEVERGDGNVVTSFAGLSFRF